MNGRTDGHQAVSSYIFQNFRLERAAHRRSVGFLWRNTMYTATSISNIEYRSLKKKAGFHNRGFMSLRDSVAMGWEDLYRDFQDFNPSEAPEESVNRS